MKKLGNVLYIMTEGSYLHCENKSICVMVGGMEKTRIPAHTIEAIVCLCNMSVSTPFMGFCGDNGISLSFHSDNGRFYGRVYGQVSGNVLLRRKQYQLIDSCESVEIVRNIILGKIINSRNVLMKASRNTTEEKSLILKEQSEKLLEQEKLLGSAQNIDSIRGIEGAAASIYFRAFDSMLKTDESEMLFEIRSRRPPENRVNALLSFTYMLLKNDMQSALESVGIDPAAGYLHTLRPGRPSMALDLMEELRSPLCDRFVISLINLKQITASDFDTEGIELTLKDKARRKVIQEWQLRKKETIMHPYLKEKIPIGLIPYCQAMLLARHFRGDIDGYPPFIWR
ncbi:MAG: type I-C CRISPR-associated endonuclease Cas1 [Oscillospiraceae bacterium]|nr:type I-C CRISPR-associated endonuclease Cas1 [Oscillospiraceae bacterium]